MLDELLLYYLYNYKIKLELGAQLSYGLLYSQSTKELKLVKEYLIKNLNKGFIKVS